jgi:hypothetical protein
MEKVEISIRVKVLPKTVCPSRSGFGQISMHLRLLRHVTIKMGKWFGTDLNGNSIFDINKKNGAPNTGKIYFNGQHDTHAAFQFFAECPSNRLVIS